jgi:hypothetical protein
MNAFYEHHRDSIRWHYRCFDRILLNGLIQPFQQPERVVGFFNTYRRLYPVTRQLLHGIADHFQKWLKGWTENAKVPVVDAPKGRRDEFVDPYFKRAKPDAIVVVLKARTDNLCLAAKLTSQLASNGGRYGSMRETGV